MVECKNCGAQNPASSLYCQDCGSRLGDWQPAEGPERMATPPTGLGRHDTDAREGEVCPRCSHVNAPHMRFCNNCGFQLDEGSSAGAVSAPPATAAGADAPVCWRCAGVGDAGAEFCKFCGARYADAPSMSAAPAVPAAPAVLKASPVAERPPPASGLPMSPDTAAGPPAASSAPATRGKLVAILKDGSDGRAYPLEADRIDLGREEGDIILGDDPYLSARHARLLFRGERPFLRDLDTVNGVYMRLREPVELGDGDMILLGQQVVRFDVLTEAELPLGPATQHGVMVFGTPEAQRVARLTQYTTEGVGRDVHYLYRDETVIGREQGDLVFTDDPFMSRRHASITVERAKRRFVLRDLGSSNGTAIRFRGERELSHGDQFRIGRHLFRYEERAGKSRPGGQAGR